MNRSVIGNLPVAVAALAMSAVFAGPDTDSRVSQLEKQMAQVRTETSNGNFGAKTASARPEVDGYGLYLSVDVLYWRASVGGTEFCYTDSLSTSDYPLDGDLREINPSWDWGFRVGAGYNFGHDAWALGLEYTYFKNDDSSKQSSGLNEDIIPTRGSAVILVDGFSEADNAVSSYNLFFQNLELTLGRDFFVSQYLSMRPYLGVQTAWINQKQNTSYSNGDQLGINSVYVNDKCDFWGMGPQFGFSSKFHAGKGFSFFGLVSGAILYGNFKVSHEDWYSATIKNQFPQTFSINGDIHQFAPTARMQIGLAYDLYMDDDKQHFGIALSYDSQYWFRQNQMLRAVDRGYADFVAPSYERYSEDLGMQGITLEARWDF